MRFFSLDFIETTSFARMFDRQSRRVPEIWACNRKLAYQQMLLRMKPAAYKSNLVKLLFEVGNDFN